MPLGGPAGRSRGRPPRPSAGTVRPELAQALGDVRRLGGEDRAPARWCAVARADYDAPVARRRPFPFHHLAGMTDDRA